MDVSKLDVDAAYEDPKDLLDSSIEKFYEWNQQVSEILNDDDGMDLIDGFINGLLHRYLKERMGGSNE
jgi:cytochrome b involved in lipid metabolism